MTGLDAVQRRGCTEWMIPTGITGTEGMMPVMAGTRVDMEARA